MPLTLDAVIGIAHATASSVSPRLKVVGVVLGSGGGEYTEIIFDIEDRRAEPCRIAIGVFRDILESELRDEITRQLLRHVEEHPI